MESALLDPNCSWRCAVAGRQTWWPQWVSQIQLISRLIQKLGWLWPDILTWIFGFFKKIQPCWRCPQGETRLKHKGRNSPGSHGDFKEGCRPVRQQRDLVAVFRKRLLQRAMGLSLSTWSWPRISNILNGFVGYGCVGLLDPWWPMFN